MADPFFHQIAGYAILLKNREAAMPKGVKAALRQSERSKNGLQLSPNVVL
jgi:hypothetical protein